MVCENFDELEKVLKEKIEFAMVTEVADIVDEAILNHVQTDVYDVYTPVEYNRRYNMDGLGDRTNLVTLIETNGDTIKMQTDNLTKGSLYHRVGNRIRKSRNSKKFLANIVETGVGYQHDFPYRNVPRPFMENTVEQLKEDQWHVGALQVGLVKQGILVKRN